MVVLKQTSIFTFYLPFPSVSFSFSSLRELKASLFFPPLQLKTNVQARLKATETELKHAHEAIEEEQEDKAELQKLLTAAKKDVAQLRANLDNEATPHIHELEATK